MCNLKHLDLSENKLECEKENDIEFWHHFFCHFIYFNLKNLERLVLNNNCFLNKSNKFCQYTNIANIIYDYYIKCYNFRDTFVTKLSDIVIYNPQKGWKKDAKKQRPKVKLWGYGNGDRDNIYWGESENYIDLLQSRLKLAQLVTQEQLPTEEWKNQEQKFDWDKWTKGRWLCHVGCIQKTNMPTNDEIATHIINTQI